MGGSCNGQIIEPYSCNPFFMAYSTPKLKILVPISISSSSAFQRYPNFPILINYQGTFGYFKFVSTFNRLSFTKTNSLKEYSKFYISGSKLSKVTRSTLQWAWASLECVEQFKIPSKQHKDSLQTWSLKCGVVDVMGMHLHVFGAIFYTNFSEILQERASISIGIYLQKR